MDSFVYRVRFAGGPPRSVIERDLQALADESNDYAGAEAFRTLLTYERLTRPPSRVAASFGTARAAFYPYQFKPLLKFLESGAKRVLIADDVGLGKTIEAGYILRELRARDVISRVLIVVPSRLRHKWKDELYRRFDEEFEIARSADFRHLFGRIESEGESPGFRWITSYETARMEHVIKGFHELTVPLDLVILDEAHKVRNPDTQQHAIASVLVQSAESVAFLTATPVQTGIENLFQLLHLLEPGNFPRFELFEQQYHSNRPVIRALRALQSSPPDYTAAATELNRFARSALNEGQQAFYESIRQRLSDGSALTRSERVALQRDVGELSLIGHVVSRTRKVDVLPDRPERSPQACRVRLQPQEQAVLDELAQNVAYAQNRGWGSQMAALTDFRYAASCIPGALTHFRRRREERKQQAGKTDLRVAVANETEDETGWLSSSPRWRVRSGVDDKKAGAGAEIDDSVLTVESGPGVDPADLEVPPTDTKFYRFVEALDKIWADDAQGGRKYRKVVVFSFFRETLKYLSSRLTERRIEHQLIAGWVPMEERAQRISRFLEAGEQRVLLSSEVGSEGLDLQRASVVVNYDLPWNPMVVEQRIGRVDRLGQRAKAIAIVNLITANSIEERILDVLYRRVGIFRESIGDLEEILGDTVEELVVEALRDGLTPEQQARKAERAADALENRIQEARRIQDRESDMLAADQAFLDEIHGLIEQRRVPDADELYRFLRGFLRKNYRGADWPETITKGIASVHIPQEVGADLEAMSRESEVRRVSGRVLRGPFDASLDQDAVLDVPRAELITMRHPLVRLAVEKLHRQADTMHRRFRLRLRANSNCRPGTYAFSVHQFDIGGVRRRLDLVPFVWVAETGGCLDEDDARLFLGELIHGADDLPPAREAEPAELARSWRALEETADTYWAELSRREETLNEARAARLRGMRLDELRSRVQTARRILEDLRDRRAKPVAVRLSEGRVKAEQARLEEFERLTSPESGAPCEMAKIAEGFVLVE